MLYISLPTADERLFFYHQPTDTLAELLLNAGPAGNHVLQVAAETPTPDDAIAAIASHMNAAHPDAADHLVCYSRAELLDGLPDFITLIHPSNETRIICPKVGLVAGFHENGAPITPVWYKPNVFTKTEKSKLVHAATEVLMISILQNRQAT